MNLKRRSVCDAGDAGRAGCQAGQRPHHQVRLPALRDRGHAAPRHAARPRPGSGEAGGEGGREERDPTKPQT